MTHALARIDDCWFLTGPTASGKTRVGLALAQRLGSEIISLDSMALYRGMDIGTAKPTAQERAIVPHHLIDLIEPEESFSVARYVEEARRAVDDILARGRVPLFVGGTPLYLKALLRGIFSGPPADWTLRRHLQQIAAKEGNKRLHARLAEVDPAAATRLHPSDTRRVIRALEVFEKTGQPIGELQKQFERAKPAEACRVFVLDWPRDELVRRIDQRVEAMFAAGLVDEARRLLNGSHPPGHTALQALGYREVAEHLRGALDLEATIALVKLRTRQFAKRQMTWFRSLSECGFVKMESKDAAGQVVQRIIDQSTNM
jgi:tRNA dimethylallyltransferase